jgi:hypothetical protein
MKWTTATIRGIQRNSSVDVMTFLGKLEIGWKQHVRSVYCHPFVGYERRDLV